jgi:hypothetical protein
MVDRHPIPHLDVAHTGADFFNHATRFVAWNFFVACQLLCYVTIAMQVATAQTAGPNSNHGLSGARLWVRKLTHFGLAVTQKNEAVHGEVPPQIK